MTLVEIEEFKKDYTILTCAELVTKYNKKKSTLLKQAIKLGIKRPKELIKAERKQTNLLKYGCENPGSNKEVREKMRQTNLLKYGCENPLGNKEIQEKRNAKNLLKYGCISPFGNKGVQEKSKETTLKTHGCVNPFSSDKIREKIKKGNIEKYGCVNPFSNKDIKERIKQTNIERYGSNNPTQNKEIRNKVIKTNIELYGIKHNSQVADWKNIIFKARLKNGNSRLINGASISEYAKQNQCSKSYLYNLRKKIGHEAMAIFSIKKYITDIESVIESILLELNIQFIHNRQLKDSRYRPDFLIESHKLIIECDGLYHHNDKFLSDNYHYNKRKKYNELGYSSLFFRSDEILEKTDIVKSVIKNKLKLSTQKIYARKCIVQKVSKDICKLFLQKNHLMGHGKGDSYGLFFNNDLKVIIQISCKDKKESLFEISRFCSLLDCTVVGSFSKLLKHVIQELKPKKIMTFVDLRYGTGHYLPSLGFNYLHTFKSFKWTNLKNTVHRMKFPGNTGYENGFLKIWDCGQAKFELVLQEHIK